MSVTCPYCNKEAVWTENKAIYGRNYGRSFMCYYCQPCGAYVGCHNNTRKPLGTMANKELREWRKKAHAVIDPIWKYDVTRYSGTSTQKRQGKSQKIRRARVYAELKNHFGRNVHVGESDVETCKKIIQYYLTPEDKWKGAGSGKE